jgi:hypothetical protein
MKIVVTAGSSLTGIALKVPEPPKCFGAGCVPGIKIMHSLKNIYECINWHALFLGGVSYPVRALKTEKLNKKIEWILY